MRSKYATVIFTPVNTLPVGVKSGIDTLQNVFNIGFGISIHRKSERSLFYYFEGVFFTHCFLLTCGLNEEMTTHTYFEFLVSRSEIVQNF